MKKILVIPVLLLCVSAFSQFPQKRILTNNLTNAVFDGGIEAKQGLINGVYADTTAANAGYIDFYNGAQIWTRSDRNFWLRDSVLNMWIRMAKFNEVFLRFGVTAEDRIASQNRTFSGLNHTYSFRFDSLDTWDVARNGTQRMYVNSIATGLYSPTGFNFTQIYDDSIAIRQISGNYSIYNLPQRFDTAANKVVTWNSSTLKLGIANWYSTPQRFGVSGEDATGTQIRKFNSGDFSFQIDSAADYTFYSNTVSNRQGQYDLAPDFFQLQIKRNDLANTYAGYYGTINGSGVPSLEYFVTRASVDRNNRVLTSANEIIFKSEQISGAVRRDYDFRVQHLPGKSSLGAGDSLTVIDNTNGQLWKIAASDLGLAGGASLSKSKTLEFPTSTENTTLWKTPVDITVSSVYAVNVGSASPSVTFNIAFGSDRTSGTNVFSSGQTATSTTTGHTFNSGFNDATIPAGSFIWITTSAQSGTVTELMIQVNYTED